MATIGLMPPFVAAAQSTDIRGWEGIQWGASKVAALNVLRTLHIHECRGAPTCADELAIDNYRLNGVSCKAELFFPAKQGLVRVTLTSPNERDAFRNALAELTRRYGQPGLQSEYDGADETTRVKWTWAARHGRLTLSSQDDEFDGLFTIVYEARSD